MTGGPAQSGRYVAIVVDHEREQTDRYVTVLRDILDPSIELERFQTGTDTLTFISRAERSTTQVCLILSGQSARLNGADLFIQCLKFSAGRMARKVLICEQVDFESARQALNRGALHATLTPACTSDELEETVRNQLTQFVTLHAPREVERFSPLLSVTQLSHAFAAAAKDRQVLSSKIKALQRSFLADVDLEDEVVERAMLEAVDEALGHPQRTHFKQGAILLQEGEAVNEISIIITGQVKLSRFVENRDMVFHSHTTGRIIGLLALAQRRKAFFTCRAVTDVSVIKLSVEELSDALDKNPWLSVHFVTTLIRSLARRNRRVTDLKVRVETLASRLKGERDQLADALKQLETTQTRLVESEKMATLGQLAAGIAHELNNPIAAIQRSIDFLAEDVLSLVSSLPEGGICKEVLHTALTTKPMTTREQRALESALAVFVGDRVLTKRLVRVGITNAQEYGRRFAGLPDKERDRTLATMERFHELGSSLRNISRCSDQIAEIVKSLRSYARTDHSKVATIDVHEGLEDTLRLFGHALKQVEVQRRFGDIPTIKGHAGELNQVWTNLVSNALHVMPDGGVLTLQTQKAGETSIVVQIIDTGPGISPENMERVFDLHFTTKEGRIQFGLGMGLSICRQIVARHGGMISVDSRPGRTCFSVALPLSHPLHDGGTSQEGGVS